MFLWSNGEERREGGGAGGDREEGEGERDDFIHGWPVARVTHLVIGLQRCPHYAAGLMATQRRTSW